MRALIGVDLDCNAGEIHAPVGENGSGQEHAHRGGIGPDPGRRRHRRDRQRRSSIALSRGARRLGIFTVYQDNSLVPDLTVAQNLYLSVTSRAAAAARSTSRRGLEEQLEHQSSWRSTSGPLSMKDLPLGTQQLVELVKALWPARRCCCSTSRPPALDASGVAILVRYVQRAAASGVAVVYISHRLGEVLALAGRLDRPPRRRDPGTYSTEQLPAGGRRHPHGGQSPSTGRVPPKRNDSGSQRRRPHRRRARRTRLPPPGTRAAEGARSLGLAGAEGNGQRNSSYGAGRLAEAPATRRATATRFVSGSVHRALTTASSS